MPLPAAIARRLASRRLIIFRTRRGDDRLRFLDLLDAACWHANCIIVRRAKKVGRVIRDEESPLV